MTGIIDDFRAPRPWISITYWVTTQHNRRPLGGGIIIFPNKCFNLGTYDNIESVSSERLNLFKRIDKLSFLPVPLIVKLIVKLFR